MLYMLGQVVVSECNVAGFFSQMNIGDLVQQWRYLWPPPLNQCLLIVNWLFAAKDPNEEHDAQVSAEETHDGTYEPRYPPHARYILVIAIDEFLEHLDVVAFIGDLMQQIPEHWIGISQPSSVMRDSADQYHLELNSDLERVRGDPAAHLNALLQGLFRVPLRGGKRSCVRLQLPTRIVSVKGVLGRVPVDVNERIETQTGRRARECFHAFDERVVRHVIPVADGCHFSIHGLCTQEPNRGGVFMAMKCSHCLRPVGVRSTRVSRVDLVTQMAPFDIADGNAVPSEGETNAETLLPDDFVGRLVRPQSPPAGLAKSVVGRAFAVTDFADQLRSHERDTLSILSGKPGVEG